jgi:hypothetical protein
MVIKPNIEQQNYSKPKPEGVLGAQHFNVQDKSLLLLSTGVQAYQCV